MEFRRVSFALTNLSESSREVPSQVAVVLLAVLRLSTSDLEHTHTQKKKKRDDKTNEQQHTNVGSCAKEGFERQRSDKKRTPQATAQQEETHGYVAVRLLKVNPGCNRHQTLASTLCPPLLQHRETKCDKHNSRGVRHC